MDTRRAGSETSTSTLSLRGRGTWASGEQRRSSAHIRRCREGLLLHSSPDGLVQLTIIPFDRRRAPCNCAPCTTKSLEACRGLSSKGQNLNLQILQAPISRASVVAVLRPYMKLQGFASSHQQGFWDCCPRPHLKLQLLSVPISKFLVLLSRTEMTLKLQTIADSHKQSIWGRYSQTSSEATNLLQAHQQSFCGCCS